MKKNKLTITLAIIAFSIFFLYFLNDYLNNPDSPIPELFEITSFVFSSTTVIILIHQFNHSRTEYDKLNTPRIVPISSGLENNTNLVSPTIRTVILFKNINNVPAFNISITIKFTKIDSNEIFNKITRSYVAPGADFKISSLGRFTSARIEIQYFKNTNSKKPIVDIIDYTF